MKLSEYKNAFDELEVSDDLKRQTAVRLKQIAHGAEVKPVNTVKSKKRFIWSIRRTAVVASTVTVFIFCAVFFSILLSGKQDGQGTLIESSRLTALAAAVDNTFEVNALDMSMDITITEGGNTETEESFFKVIERDNTQIAYINKVSSILYQSYEALVFTDGDDIYLSEEGWAPRKIGNFHGVTDEYTDIGVDMLALSQLDLQLREISPDVFKVNASNQDLNNIIKELEGLVENIGVGDFEMTIQLDSETGLFSQIDYKADYKVGEKKFSMTAVIKILAVNDDVTFDIPKTKVVRFWENIVFTVQENTITGLTAYGGTLAHVEIPNEINGRPVTAIGERAFANDRVKAITIPKTVTEIGFWAFIGCTDLVVIMKGSVPPTIYGSPFDDFFSRPKAVVVPVDALDVYKTAWKMEWAHQELPICTADNIDGDFIILGGVLLAYLGNSKNVVIPGGVNAIGNYVFFRSPIQSIIIPEGVTSIGAAAFYDCVNLKTVRVPASVQNIKDGAFFGCQALVYFESYSPPVIDGVIYFSSIIPVVPEAALIEYQSAWKDKTWIIITQSDIIDESFIVVNGELIRYIGENPLAIIPEGVTDIRAFFNENGSRITHLELPRSMTSIGNSAFHYLYELKSIKIPETIKSIERGAFSGRSVVIHFAGTTPPLTGDYAFGYGGIRIIVPAAAVEIYKAAWGNYTDVIYADSDIIDNDFLVVDGVLKQYMGNEKNVVIPEGVTAIDAVFPDGVESILVPGSVIDISWGFRGRISNLVVYMECLPPEGSWYWFSGILAFIVPDEYLDAYISILPDGLIPNPPHWNGIFFPKSSVVDNRFIIIDGALMQYLGREESVKIPDAVTTIAREAFCSLDFVTVIYIPGSVTQILTVAVLEDATLYFDGVIPPVFKSAEWFGGAYNVKEIRVPHSAVRTYKAAWPLYAPIIYQY